MRGFYAWMVVAVTVGLAACSGSTPAPSSPTPAAAAPAAPTQAPAAGTTSGVAGIWVGTAADSSGVTAGTCMGIPGAGAGNMTWTLTQTGPDTFTGTMGYPGMPGGRQVNIAGTINGRTGTFTITMPTGTMPMMGWCGGQITGTWNLDDLMAQMHGTYSGTTTCAGPFNNGQLTLHRR